MRAQRLGEVEGHDAAFQPQHAQQPREAIGERLALAQHRQDRLALLVDQAALGNEERVDMIDIQPRADRHVDQRLLLRRDDALAPQRGEQLEAPAPQRANGRRSMIERVETMGLDEPFERMQA